MQKVNYSFGVFSFKNDVENKNRPYSTRIYIYTCIPHSYTVKTAVVAHLKNAIFLVMYMYKAFLACEMDRFNTVFYITHTHTLSVYPAHSTISRPPTQSPTSCFSLHITQVVSLEPVTRCSPVPVLSRDIHVTISVDHSTPLMD